MPSKYTATVGFNQEIMDALVDIFPEINDATKFKNTSQITQYIVDFVAGGGFVKKELFLKIQNSLDELQREEKQQKILNLKIKNRIALIHDLKVPPTETLEIVNNNLKIEQSSSHLARFSPEQMLQYVKPEHITDEQLNSEQSPYHPSDDKKQSNGQTIGQLHCTDCGIIPDDFSFTKGDFNSFSRAQTELIRHLREKHRRYVNPIEESIILRLCSN
jgi:hypothetical protein